MRLGAYECQLMANSLAHKAYKQERISERHRHRYEFNNTYKREFESKGLRTVGINPSTQLCEIVENTEHPWMVGVQFHPEYQSKPLAPHPLFVDFIQACKVAQSNKR